MQIVDARRVLAADRGGSSWPIVVETDDGVRFAKLRGAAQGTAPLVAEVIVAELAGALGLHVPARSLVRIDDRLESDDRDQELADLLVASRGVNLGFTLLDAPRKLQPEDIDAVRLDEAAAILWLDGLVMNPDRTAGNPNLLWWQDDLWLIDHGAALGFQYRWPTLDEDAPRQPLAMREPHLLRARAPDLSPWDDAFAARMTRDVIERAVETVPDSFLDPLLETNGTAATSDARRRRRAAYVAFLWKRRQAPRPFLVAVPSTAPEPKRGRPSWLTRGRG